MLDVALACLCHPFERCVRLNGVLNRFEALTRRPAVHREVALVTRVAFEGSRRRYVVILRSRLLLSPHVPLRVIH